MTDDTGAADDTVALELTPSEVQDLLARLSQRVGSRAVHR